MADLSEIDLRPDPFVPLSTPVHYGGVCLRSKLERSWARMFDEQRIPYRYEPEPFKLGLKHGRYDEKYLPDFVLGPRLAAKSGYASGMVYAEVKPDGDDFRKARRFAAEYKQPILCLEGDPRAGPLRLVYGSGSEIQVELREGVMWMVSW